MSVVTADWAMKYILPGEFLRAHDGGWEWDHDDSGDRAVLIDPLTGEETYFTGIACAWNPDEVINSYEIYSDGTRAGQKVKFHHNGRVKRMDCSDGTMYEFHESGTLQRVVFTCGWTQGARRRFDNAGQVVEEWSYGEDWGDYLDRVARRPRSAREIEPLVLPAEYVVAHGQDVGCLGVVGSEGQVPTDRVWSGLAFSRHDNGSVAGYEFRVRGTPVGRWARFRPDGTLWQVGGAMGGLDGASYEFYASGGLARVSLWCRGKPIGFRELDESGQMVNQQVATTWDTWGAYLDWAVSHVANPAPIRGLECLPLHK
ncbi:MAG: hypothetical protein FWG14_02535 [Peptococcaceae bacterium]|nr:hypothetical protein [Peptococcaceae bacterium]